MLKFEKFKSIRFFSLNLSSISIKSFKIIQISDREQFQYLYFTQK